MIAVVKEVTDDNGSNVFLFAVEATLKGADPLTMF